MLKRLLLPAALLLALLAPASALAALVCQADYFPGSIAHGLGAIEDELASMPRSESAAAAARAARRTLATVAADPLDRLHDGLEGIQADLAAVHEEIQAAYFPPLPARVPC